MNFFCCWRRQESPNNIHLESYVDQKYEVITQHPINKDETTPLQEKEKTQKNQLELDNKKTLKYKDIESVIEKIKERPEKIYSKDGIEINFEGICSFLKKGLLTGTACECYCKILYKKHQNVYIFSPRYIDAFEEENYQKTLKKLMVIFFFLQKKRKKKILKKNQF
jgi:hypothetical protein